MKYYREVICGDRNKISDSTAYYKGDRFGLSAKLGNGVYSLLDDFLNASYTAAQDWGFYPWLKELQTHTHKLGPYVLDKTHDMREVLSHKVIRVTGINPIKDDTLSKELNESSKGLSNYSDQTFFKVLRNVMKAKYEQVKK